MLNPDRFINTVKDMVFEPDLEYQAFFWPSWELLGYAGEVRHGTL